MEDISIYSVVTALNKSGVLLDGKNVPACIFLNKVITNQEHQAVGTCKVFFCWCCNTIEPEVLFKYLLKP